MKGSSIIAGLALIGLGWVNIGTALADDEQLAYAVVSDVPKDMTRISAKIAIDGTVSDLKLLAPENILSNLIWKKLEICHAMRLEGQRSGEGFRVSSVRVVDASMLPMVLQSFAGDCLLKKALEVGPLVD